MNTIIFVQTSSAKDQLKCMHNHNQREYYVQNILEGW